VWEADFLAQTERVQKDTSNYCKPEYSIAWVLRVVRTESWKRHLAQRGYGEDGKSRKAPQKRRRAVEEDGDVLESRYLVR
jgi:hypothetical protein